MEDAEYRIKRSRMLVIENICTLLCIAGIILGVLAITGEYYGFWALLLMNNLNGNVDI